MEYPHRKCGSDVDDVDFMCTLYGGDVDDVEFMCMLCKGDVDDVDFMCMLCGADVDDVDFMCIYVELVWMMWIHNVEFPHVHIYTLDEF